MQLAALPMLPPAISGDPSLFENSSYGPLPRVSPDGRRPREAYARRAAPVPDGVPRIVIVVGGLGLSQTGTQKRDRCAAAGRDACLRALWIEP